MLNEQIINAQQLWKIKLTLSPIIDLKLLASRQLRAEIENVTDADFLLRYVAQEMDERLSLIERTFNSPLQVNGYTQDLADQIRSRKQTSEFTFQNYKTLGTEATHSENLQLKKTSHDLILSPLSLHLTNDTPGIFAQFHRALQPDGLLSASVLGAGTLSELRESLLTAESEIYGGASARVIPFADIRDYGGLLQRTGFALPVIDSDTLTVRYDDVFTLMKDLRAMGMTNPLVERTRRPVGRGFFHRVNEIYKERFADPDGRIRASYVIIYLAGWKPHESQQKPLKPGSATRRLSDALNADEIKLKN